MTALLQRFLSDRSGATSIEYALLAVVVSLAPMAAFAAVGDGLAGLIEHAASQLAGAGTESGIRILP